MSDWKCKQCGLCCRTFIQPIDTPLSDDAKKFFEGFRNKVVIDDYHMCFKEKCKHLQKKNGHFYCDCYEDRPQFCRDFGENNCKTLQTLKEMGKI